jgi:hypothetical protein
LLSGKKYPFIIKIKEKPWIGRSSIIFIKIGDVKIYEFYANPNEDFLKLTVKTVLTRVHMYARQRVNLLRKSKI